MVLQTGTLMGCHDTRQRGLAGTYWSARWLCLHRCWLLLGWLWGWHRLGLGRGLWLRCHLGLGRSLPRGGALGLRGRGNRARRRGRSLSRGRDRCGWLCGRCWLGRSHSRGGLVLHWCHPGSSGHWRCALVQGGLRHRGTRQLPALRPQHVQGVGKSSTGNLPLLGRERQSLTEPAVTLILSITALRLSDSTLSVQADQPRARLLRVTAPISVIAASSSQGPCSQI